MTAGIGLGLEPPLSPPVVRGPSASVPMPADQPSNNTISDLPTPPPAIRPPESVAPAPEPASMPQAEVPQQPEQVQPEQAPVPAQPEPILPIALPEPVQLQPPAAEPEPELPVMAPAEEAVVDYFAPPEPAAETLPEITPVEESPAEPAQLPEIAPIPLIAPAPPVEEPAAELPTMAPVEPELEIAPVAFFAPQPVETTPELEVEIQAEVAPEPLAAPEPLVAAEPELKLPDDPFEAVLPAPEQVASPEIEELFAPQRNGQFRVVVRLREGDGVEVGEFRDFGTAMEGAQEVIEQFSTASEGQWPFYAGRFIRPDLIVSVDVVEGEQTEQ
jgi:nicotinate-nucleotide--dimethylbenzimidazole phosphoribosyltransferase